MDISIKSPFAKTVVIAGPKDYVIEQMKSHAYAVGGKFLSNDDVMRLYEEQQQEKKITQKAIKVDTKDNGKDTKLEKVAKPSDLKKITKKDNKPKSNKRKSVTKK